MKKHHILEYILIIVPILFLLAFIALQAYLWVKYAHLTMEETPNWVHWIMWKK